MAISFNLLVGLHKFLQFLNNWVTRVDLKNLLWGTKHPKIGQQIRSTGLLSVRISKSLCSLNFLHGRSPSIGSSYKSRGRVRQTLADYSFLNLESKSRKNMRQTLDPSFFFKYLVSGSNSCSVSFCLSASSLSPSSLIFSRAKLVSLYFPSNLSMLPKVYSSMGSIMYNTS